MPVVIKLKGMPWEASSRDIKDFFRDSKIAEHDIHLAPNEDGKACGVGFACFFDDEDARKAMQRNGAYLGKRYVELFLSSQAEMEKALRDGVPLTSSDLRPSKHDSRRGERTEKPSRDRSRSPRDRSSSKFGKRNEPFNNSGSSFHTRSSSGNTEFKSKSGSSFVKPRTAGINGRESDKGREGGFKRGGFRGRGYGRGESTRGSTRGGMRGGGSRGNLSFSSSRPHHNSDNRLSRGGQQFKTKRDSSGSRSDFFVSQQPQYQSGAPSMSTGAVQGMFLKLSGLPYTAQNMDIQEFFKGINIAAVHIIPNKSGPYAGRSSGSAFVECSTQADCLKALAKHGEFLGRRYLNVVRCNLEEIVSTLNIDINLLTGQFPMEANSKGLEMPSRNQSSSAFASSSLSSLAGGGPSAAEKTINLVAASANINLGDIKDGCVVGIRNLPTSATPEEILRFFRGYPAIPDSVRIHYLDSNRCSGDAMITLVSNEQARNAIRQLSGKQFGSRKIELFLL